MASWGVADAKAKFSEMLDEAQQRGPQEITRNGKPFAVVISIEEWKQEYGSGAPEGSILDFFRRSPLRGSGLKVGRVRLDPRPVKF